MKGYTVLFPEKFTDYELVDSGNGSKLERFGKYTLIRPEPKAIWSPQLSMEEWQAVAHARFEAEDAQKGKWHKLKDMKMPWKISYRASNFTLWFELRFTQFKHLGVFPEQASHWEFVYDQAYHMRPAKVLNLFAYTGAASLAAKAAGADVIHCESMKQVVAWAKHNMQISKLDDVRWLIEDVLKFVKREAKRGNVYNGIIMDPPAFGVGPNGERWKLESQLKDLLHHTSKLLLEQQAFIVFNTYSANLSPLALKTMVEQHFGLPKQSTFGELALRKGNAQVLPTGAYYRFVR